METIALRKAGAELKCVDYLYPLKSQIKSVFHFSGLRLMEEGTMRVGYMNMGLMKCMRGSTQASQQLCASG